jgi:hypothetical protein
MEQDAAVLRELALVHPSNTRRVEACEMGALALEDLATQDEDLEDDLPLSPELCRKLGATTP